MNTHTGINTIRFKATRTGGRRAYFWSSPNLRWMPIAAAKADLLVATGQAEDVTGTDHL